MCLCVCVCVCSDSAAQIVQCWTLCCLGHNELKRAWPNYGAIPAFASKGRLRPQNPSRQSVSQLMFKPAASRAQVANV